VGKGKQRDKEGGKEQRQINWPGDRVGKKRGKEVTHTSWEKKRKYPKRDKARKNGE